MSGLAAVGTRKHPKLSGRFTGSATVTACLPVATAPAPLAKAARPSVLPICICGLNLIVCMHDHGDCYPGGAELRQSPRRCRAWRDRGGDSRWGTRRTADTGTTHVRGPA